MSSAFHVRQAVDKTVEVVGVGGEVARAEESIDVERVREGLDPGDVAGEVLEASVEGGSVPIGQPDGLDDAEHAPSVLHEVRRIEPLGREDRRDGVVPVQGVQRGLLAIAETPLVEE